MNTRFFLYKYSSNIQNNQTSEKESIDGFNYKNLYIGLCIVGALIFIICILAIVIKK